MDLFHPELHAVVYNEHKARHRRERQLDLLAKEVILVIVCTLAAFAHPED